MWVSVVLAETVATQVEGAVVAVEEDNRCTEPAVGDAVDAVGGAVDAVGGAVEAAVDVDVVENHNGYYSLANMVPVYGLQSLSYVD